ncbi:MAG TPA: Uma2 family endonuclease [Puia sp.]|nr:Uma2 family endonuclease [Puia sp.]
MEFAELDLSREYSYADYLQWTFEERLEIIKGKLFKMSPAPSRIHQKLSGEIFGVLFNFLKGKTCEVYSAPFDVRLPRKSLDDKEIITVVQPDLCVICDPAKLDAKGCLGAPDIIIEILSPGNNKKELENKYEVYEEAGVKEYWLILPQEQACFQYILNDDGRYMGKRPLTEGNILTTPLLPGFELDLEEVFGVL